MAFLQPCFIRKNTPKLRKNLEYFGYKPFGSVKYEWDTGYGLSTDNRLGEFESFDNNGLKNIIKCGSPDYEDSIDCGTNEELFLALAALRDDTDINQWVIDEANECFGLGDSMMICDKDNMNDRNIYTYYRKATVEEIIEYFKDR